MADYEKLMQDAKDAQRYERIQSWIGGELAKSMRRQKLMLGCSLGATGAFGAASGVYFSHNYDEAGIGILQLIAAGLFAVASGFNYAQLRSCRKQRQALLEEAKGLEARVE